MEGRERGAAAAAARRQDGHGRPSSPSHAERRQWRHERHEMRDRLRQLAETVQREASRREEDVEELEVRLAVVVAENVTLKRDLKHSRKLEADAVRSAEDVLATKRDSMRAVFEEAERDFHERSQTMQRQLAEEARAREEAEARADLALRRQLELDQLLAEQTEEAALIFDEMQSYREQAAAECRLRKAQEGEHVRVLNELKTQWERQLALERTNLERQRTRMVAEQDRIIAEQQLKINEQAALRDDAARVRLDGAVTTGKATADSILRRVERLVGERHAIERVAAASPPVLGEARR